jgi:GNAT superfamily N-acetyltransferase
MSADFTIQQAIPGDSHEVAVMVGELLAEIIEAINEQAFNFDLAETTSRLEDFLNSEKYFVFVVRSGSRDPAGFIALYESNALYAEGAFGTIPELYVRPDYRTNGFWAFVSCPKQNLSVCRVAGQGWRLQLRRYRSSREPWPFMSVKVLR